LKSSIATVLGGMASKSDDPTALRNMLDLAPSAAADTNLAQMAHAATDPSSPLISAGKRLLSGLFGNSEAAVTDAISAASGLRGGTASTILAMAAPMVMSFLSRRVRAEGMNMHGLGDLLKRESGGIRNAMPAGLADMFWPTRVEAAAPVVAQAVTREGASFPWLPLIALALLIPGFFWFLNHARRPAVSKVVVVTPTQREPVGTASRIATDSTDTVRRALADNADFRFDNGSARLRPESEARLDKLADTLKTYPDVNMSINGYTDNTGNADHNLQLSQQRANGVMAILVRKGISADRCTAQGHGEENPIADNSTADGRAQNRRVSVAVLQR
jgi:outer membrane protein OmpA-like peptidoglycan-associated protein